MGKGVTYLKKLEHAFFLTDRLKVKFGSGSFVFRLALGLYFEIYLEL